MKNIVIWDEIKTGDFKPSILSDEYRQLTQKDVPIFFPKESLSICACPACQSKEVKKRFERFSLTYQICANCLSWYVSPRPEDSAIFNFYKHSPARKFWNESLYNKTENRRKEKIIKPRFEWVMDSVAEYFPGAHKYADFNANQCGYVAQIENLFSFHEKTLINPLVPAVGLTETHVMDLPWWQVNGQWDVVTLFEVLDHTAQVNNLMTKVNEGLSKGGLCFMTGIFASGFDLQVLGDQAPHVIPPDRLNALTVEGLKQLVTRHGFECLEISTPGILDVAIVTKVKQDNPSLALGDFVEYLLTGPLERQEALTEFLQANLLSSYGRILLRKI